jgi:hypothetical protein
MRSSSTPRRRAAAARAAALGAGVSVALGWLLAAASVALAASPEPSQGAGGDPRSSGQGPGLVGDPLFAVMVVVVIGVIALAATLLYVRATGGARR